MYKPLSDILDDIAADLSALENDDGDKIFKAVGKAMVSAEEQLWEVIDTINIQPCAVVFHGPAGYEEQALVRRPTITVCVIDKFVAKTSSKPAGVLPLADAVIASFTPVCAEDEKPVYKEIDGIGYEVKGHSPVPVPKEYIGLAAFAIEIEAAELSAYEVEV